jgi:Uma2 family endonuclease
LVTAETDDSELPPPPPPFAPWESHPFAAGTLVVWDVDPVADRVLVYRATDPGRPSTFGRGQVADVEPAVPGWRLDVDRIFA